MKSNFVRRAAAGSVALCGKVEDRCRTADNEADEQEVAVGDMTPGTPVEVDDSEASASEAEDLEMFADESSPPVLWPR